MKTIWTKGLDDEQKEKVEAEFKRAEPAMARLKDIIVEKEHKARRADDYVDSSWPYKAADRNGYIRALQEVKTLIES